MSSSCCRGYLGDDGCAFLGPNRGRTLAGSCAASVTPATFCHPRWQQTGSTGGQLSTARSNQRYLGDLRQDKKTRNLFFLQTSLFPANKITPKNLRCILVLHLCASELTLLPVTISKAPSDWSAPSNATLAEIGLESRRMFTWGEAFLEKSTWKDRLL